MTLHGTHSSHLGKSLLLEIHLHRHRGILRELRIALHIVLQLRLLHRWLHNLRLLHHLLHRIASHGLGNGRLHGRLTHERLHLGLRRHLDALLLQVLSKHGVGPFWIKLFELLKVHGWLGLGSECRCYLRLGGLSRGVLQLQRCGNLWLLYCFLLLYFFGLFRFNGVNNSLFDWTLLALEL